MPVIHDEEFGSITVTRSVQSRQVRIRIAPDGSLKASMPRYTPLAFLKKMVKTSRVELRDMIDSSRPKTNYYDGQPIGKRHTLVVRQGASFSVVLKGPSIIVTLEQSQALSDRVVMDSLRKTIIKVLRSEAKTYLTKRLAYLADTMNCTYSRVRFSHASSRWGSCSSTGTISLNIALMKLPLELIDYVVIHELAHTKEMNHSASFWDIVALFDPAYKIHRRQLKNETPSI